MGRSQGPLTTPSFLSHLIKIRWGQTPLPPPSFSMSLDTTQAGSRVPAEFRWGR